VKGEAEATKNMVQTERGPAILQIMADQAIDFGQTWENFRADYDRLYGRLESGELDYEHFTKELEYLDAKHQAKIKQDNDLNLQQYKVSLRELVLTTNTPEFHQQDRRGSAVWQDFWQTRRRLFRSTAKEVNGAGRDIRFLDGS
jgi:hypothetical protein